MSDIVPGRHAARRERPRTRLTPLAVLVVLAALLLPVSTALAVPGQPPGHGQGKPAPGQAGPGPAGQGQPGPGAEQPVEPPEPVWTGVPGTNLAHDTFGYPWPAAPDCDESNVGTGGCVNDGVGFFQGQCTSWVAYRLGQRNGLAFHNWFEGQHWGNASEWARVARGLGYRPDRVPAAGAVGWYARGHVSYVEEVNDDGSVVISEMNTDGHNGFVVHTVHPGDSSWPDRFLHLADVVPVDHTPPGAPEPVRAVAADRTVEVAWSAPADDTGVTGYRVLRNGVQVAETTAPSYVDRQASPGQAYTYSVVAHDEAGNVSAPAATVLAQGLAAPRGRHGPFLPESASIVAAGDSTAVCGRLGTVRDQRVGCRLRTLDGWRTVRTGRHVPWGLPATRSFVPDATGTVWYCRVLPGERATNACVPLHLASMSWGFDRIDTRGAQPAYASWVGTDAGPARCGTVGDRATCATLVERGWRHRTTEPGMRAGDPLSRAFVRTPRGIGFCRSVAGHATCTVLVVDRLVWGRRDAVSLRPLPHGRWVSRRLGPMLCLEGHGDCRPIPRTKA